MTCKKPPVPGCVWPLEDHMLRISLSQKVDGHWSEGSCMWSILISIVCYGNLVKHGMKSTVKSLDCFFEYCEAACSMTQLNLSPAHPPHRPSKLNFFQPAAAYPNLRLHHDTKQRFRVQQFRETGRNEINFRNAKITSSLLPRHLFRLLWEKKLVQFVSQQVKLKKTEENKCIWMYMVEMNTVMYVSWILR